METKLNFKSQIATSRVQSERLLSLGLKKETADDILDLHDKNQYPEVTFENSPQEVELVIKK